MKNNKRYSAIKNCLGNDTKSCKLTINRLINFTLIELLVVIAIISILAAMMLPALSQAKYTAKLLTCKNRFKQLGILMFAYTGDNDGCYPYVRAGQIYLAEVYHIGSGKAAYDFRDEVAPYLSSLNAIFNDPLAPSMHDLDNNPNGPFLNNKSVWSPLTSIWGGNQGEFGPSRRITQANWEIRDPSPENEKAYTSVIAGDCTLGVFNLSLSKVGSHPTQNGASQKLVPASATAFARWEGEVDGAVVDNNYLFSDGHVKTYYRIYLNDPKMIFNPNTRFPGYFVPRDLK